MISPPCVEMRSLTFAVSMLVPPPTATNPSNSPPEAKSAASCNESPVGSTRALSQTSTSIPSPSISSRTRGVIPAATTPGSETSITLPTPSRPTSQPTSSAAPGPYLRGVASIVKMVSLPDPPFPCMVVRLLSREQRLTPLFPSSPGKYTSGPTQRQEPQKQRRQLASSLLPVRTLPPGMCREPIPSVFQYNRDQRHRGEHTTRCHLDGAKRVALARDEEVFGLAEERGRGTGMDPAELWRQWFESGSRVWADVLRGSQVRYMDPYGLYRQWFEGMRKRMMGTSGANGSEETQEMWRKWFGASVESWEKSVELGQEMMGMTPRWIEMLEQARTNLMSARSFPKDPLEFAVQWYNATSGPFSEFIQDVIEQEEFLEPASQWLQSYASFYKLYARRSEEYLKSLQVPVRSDITRVAGLVVALEDKVDRLEEAFEEFEYGYARPATAEEVGELEKRLDRVEGKLDRLLAALENVPAQNGAPDATDAARRKARELGVDLTEIVGTGAGGQITVDDVRRRGES